ncbi:helix-turn-helix domain-containing protein [Pseudomonas sp. NCHU5208]|uniref:helix-turn-helix domain-containing protein n=1 Tax=unclassified Pseudomonas TaxID=196821 RepID=UPI003F964D47
MSDKSARSAPKSPTHKAMGEILRAIRLKKNLTLQELTRDLQIDNSSLSRVERGQQGLPQDTLASLLEYYGLSLPKLLIQAAGLTEGDLAKARAKTRVRQEDELSTPKESQSVSDDGWVTHNQVLFSRVYASHQMLLCRTSFENPEFELIYMGRTLGGLTSLHAAKFTAANFARKVLREEGQKIV